MFKKWYWMVVLGVFDFIIENRRMAWNMLSEEDHYKALPLPDLKFHVILAEQMIALKDESACDHVAEARMHWLMILS